jgi:hypothetical protein
MPDLVFFKLGRAVRYRYSDVVAFIGARSVTSTLAAKVLMSNVPTERPSRRKGRCSEGTTLKKSPIGAQDLGPCRQLARGRSVGDICMSKV